MLKYYLSILLYHLFHWGLFLTIVVLIAYIPTAIFTLIFFDILWMKIDEIPTRKEKKLFKKYGVKSWEEYQRKKKEEIEEIKVYNETHFMTYIKPEQLRLFHDDPVKALESDPKLKRLWETDGQYKPEFSNEKEIIKEAQKRIAMQNARNRVSANASDYNRNQIITAERHPCAVFDDQD